MADNAQKIPLTISLNETAKQRAQNAIQRLGKALPASVVSVSGAIVTVNFEVQSGYTLPQVKVPLFGPEYIRYPIQQGCKGVVFPADAYLGGMSGLGGGVATLAPPPNLTALVFFPIGNAGWSAVDPNATTIYGPNGVVLRDEGSACIFTLTPDGISIKVPSGQQIAIQGNGGTINIADANVTATNSTVAVTGGDISADGISLKTHVHGGVQSGGSDTGPPA